MKRSYCSSRTIAKLFDLRRPPRRQQNSKVETAGSRFGGIDVLGTDSTVWKDFAIVLTAAVWFIDSRLSYRYIFSEGFLSQGVDRNP